MAETYTGITPADVTGYRDKLNKLLGTDQISGVWAPPKSPITYPSAITTPATLVTPPVVAPTVATPPAVAPVITTPPAKVATTPSAYAGGSIVDYLSSTGKPSDFNSRATLAKNAGIANYTGSAEQNTQLLNTLRGGTTPATKGATVVTPPAPTVTTPTSVTTPTADELARQKATQKQAEMAGSAGLSVADWTATQMPTAEESAKIAKELGITALEGEVFKKPSQSSEEIYNKAFQASGLADIKSQVMKLNEEINTAREGLRTDTGKIDENPFLTETSRVGRGKRLLTQYEAKITNQLDQAKRLQDLYDKGVEEINKIVTRSATDFGVNQTIDQAKLNYLQKKAEVETKNLTTKKVTEGLSSYLAGKTSGTKPEVIGGQDTGYFRWDTTLKKFIQVVPASAKSVADNSTFKPTADQKSLVGRFANSSMSKDLGFTEADKARLNTDSNFFYWALQKATEAGMY